MKTLANLKELYEKDFYQWITENIELLKNKEFDLVDWENLLEEIEDMGRRYLDIAVSFIAIILSICIDMNILERMKIWVQVGLIA